MLTKKIKAGALQYVIIISTIILIILLGFLQLMALQKKVAIKNNLYKESILNVNNGFHQLSNINLPYNTITTQQLSENEKEKATFFKKKWGIYNIVHITSHVAKETFKKIGLIGYKTNKKKAIYLTSHNTPLILVGTSTIIGNADLPNKGVKKGNISGTSFYGKRLINGKINKSSTHLPALKEINFTKNEFLTGAIENINLNVNDNIIQSFFKNTLYYNSNTSIRLHNIVLKGNIIIESNRKIIVDKSAILEDIILIAPEIVVQTNVNGNFQMFASEKIHIQKNCTLNYPSSVVINTKKVNTKEESILIAENTTVKGIVLYKQNSTKKIKTNFSPQIKISKNTNIAGEVYCEGNLELLGNIKGCVYTNNFITKQFGSVYLNHIYNGNINALNLPEEYSGLNFNSKKQGVSKWLY